MLALLLVAACGHKNERQEVKKKTLTLAVASSLRLATPRLIQDYLKKQTNLEILATYGASGSLRKQVEAGAPIDGVLFASAAPVDTLIKNGLLLASSRRVVATNELVLIGSKGASPYTFQTLTKLPSSEKLAIGEPGAVPAGRYARSAFQALGTWEKLQDRLVFGGDVAAVLAYARRGEVAAAVVYSTDLHAINDVQVFDRAKAPWSPSPQVVVGIVKNSEQAKETKAFLDFVESKKGQQILKSFGFGAPDEDRAEK